MHNADLLGQLMALADAYASGGGSAARERLFAYAKGLLAAAHELRACSTPTGRPSLCALEAVSQMAPNRHSYNLGVLTMLGHEELARQHETRSLMVEALVAKRDALIPDETKKSDNLLAQLTLPPEVEDAVAQAQSEVEAAARSRDEAWAQIQAFIDEAQAELERRDPFGMRQSV